MDSYENKKNIDLFHKMIASEKFIILGKMSSSIAHEINNPIMIIQNLVLLMLEDIEENEKLIVSKNSEFHESLQEVILECKRISKITKGLQTFSRSSSMKLQNKELEMLLLDVVNFMQPLFVKAQVQVKINSEAKITKCKIKPDQIQQVIVNLLDNSLYSLNKKYGLNQTSRDEKVIEITFKNELIGIGIDGEKINYAVIEIYDDGMGISDEAKKNIFKPFFSTKKSKENLLNEAEKNQGLGLGLSFSQIILRDHNGFILFESKENEFARFSLYLPLITDLIEDQDDQEEIVF